MGDGIRLRIGSGVPRPFVAGRICVPQIGASPEPIRSLISGPKRPKTQELTRKPLK